MKADVRMSGRPWRVSSCDALSLAHGTWRYNHLFHRAAKKCWLLVNSASIRIVPRTHGNRDRAGLGYSYLSLGGSGGNPGGGGGTSKGEKDDEGANKVLHDKGAPRNLRSVCQVWKHASKLLSNNELTDQFRRRQDRSKGT